LARPQKEGLDYFPHDTDATSDEKLEAMRALHGNDGYAFYFILLERIYRTSNGELDVSNISKRAAIISKVGVSPEKFNAMLEDAFELELFDKAIYEQKQHITSNGIKKRVEEVKKLREKWRKKKETSSGENTGDSSKKGQGEESNPIGKVFQFYQQNIGAITPFQAEAIGQYLDEGMEPDMIIAVMQDGIGKDNPWSWIKKVLANSDKNNIRTLAQYEAKKVEKERKNSVKDNSKPQNNRPTFDNFKKREYDPKALEDMLLKKSKGELSTKPE
jgi:DnaD/phage-associated family protein